MFIPLTYCLASAAPKKRRPPNRKKQSTTNVSKNEDEEVEEDKNESEAKPPIQRAISKRALHATVMIGPESYPFAKSFIELVPPKQKEGESTTSESSKEGIFVIIARHINHSFSETQEKPEITEKPSVEEPTISESVEKTVETTKEEELKPQPIDVVDAVQEEPEQQQTKPTTTLSIFLRIPAIQLHEKECQIESTAPIASFISKIKEDYKSPLEKQDLTSFNLGIYLGPDEVAWLLDPTKTPLEYQLANAVCCFGMFSEV